MKNSKLVLLSLFVGILGAGAVSNAFATDTNPFQKSLSEKEGGSQGGGGDAVTERRIKEIRDNLMDFIQRGGDASLDLKGRLTLKEYRDGNEAKGLYGMKLVLKEGAVVVNAIKASEEDLNDELRNTRVNGARKICKGIFSAKRDGFPYIICDVDAFAKMDANPEKNADLQTVQIAHEYHSLAGIERNHASNSQYWLSDQLREFMGNETVRRLIVGKKAPRSVKHPMVTKIQKLFAQAPTAKFDDLKKVEWSKDECIGLYATSSSSSMSSSNGVTVQAGNFIWTSLPDSVSRSLEAKKFDASTYVTSETPNVPYGAGVYEAYTALLNLSPSGSVLSASTGTGDFVFTAKLVDTKTLVMEASMSVAKASSIFAEFMPGESGGPRHSMPEAFGPSVNGKSHVPFAYYLCRHQ